MGGWLSARAACAATGGCVDSLGPFAIVASGLFDFVKDLTGFTNLSGLREAEPLRSSESKNSVNRTTSRWRPWLALVLVTGGLLLAGFRGGSTGSIALDLQPEPTPTIDRLAPPVMPEHPTQFDIGRSVYHLNCMPCHGDQGQGLTDEFRALWVEDHQNCWARGCHGGRVEDEGYTLPHTIPPVIGPTPLARFKSVDELYEYVRNTQPVQRPGALSEADYRAVTAFLWQASGYSSADDMLASSATPSQPVLGDVAIILLGSGMVITAGAVWVIRRRNRRV